MVPHSVLPRGRLEAGIGQPGREGDARGGVIIQGLLMRPMSHIFMSRQIYVFL